MNIFISYSRVDKNDAEKITSRLRRGYPSDKIWYDDDIQGGDRWWDVILDRIAESDIFIYLLSNESVNSPYCQAEFAEALRLRKRIITVQVRDSTKLTGELSEIQYVDLKAGIDDAEAQASLFGAINHQIKAVTKRSPKPLSPKRTSRPRIEDEKDSQPTHSDIETPNLSVSLTGATRAAGLNEPQAIIRAAWVAGIFGLAGIALAFLLPRIFPPPSLTPTPTIQVAFVTTEAPEVTPTTATALLTTSQTTTATEPSYTSTPAPTSTHTPTATMTSSTTATLAPTFTLSLTPTSEETAISATPTPIATTMIIAPITVTLLPTDTPVAPNLLLKQRTIGITNASPINIRYGPSTEFDVVVQLNEDQQVVILSTSDDGAWYRIELANAPNAWISKEFVFVPEHQPPRIGMDIKVQNNAAWQPNIAEYTRVLNDLEMVLVPAGCFIMGSTKEQIDYAMSLFPDLGRDFYADERPSRKICFDKPFWIDKYEVTNEQYGSDGYWSGVNLPRESVNWIDAKAHCENRDARLPSEAEWEYSARGPDGLIFPWGNTEVRDYAVYTHNPDTEGKTVSVGSKPEGISWVGAFDLSGNVWEWVSTRYDQANYPYPYRIDGRESLSTEGTSYGLRGGAWQSGTSDIRSANRSGNSPYNTSFGVGFRCARDWQPEE